MEMPRLARPWVAPLARIGYATKGVVHFLVGSLAVLAALGRGGNVSGNEGAIRTIGEQPFGKVLLIAAAIGLAAHAVWRLLQATLNLEREGGAKGAFKRIGYVFSVLAHGALAGLAVQLAAGQGGGGRGAKGLVAQVLSAPLGEMLVGVVGAVLVGYGIFQLYAAATGRLPERLEGNRGPQVWGVRIGRLGLAARGIVFGIIGYHLMKAAIDSRPGEIKDMGAVLREIASQPQGHLMLVGVAAGLAAYGLYMLVCARYARIADG